MERLTSSERLPELDRLRLMVFVRGGVSEAVRVRVEERLFEPEASSDKDLEILDNVSDQVEERALSVKVGVTDLVSLDFVDVALSSSLALFVDEISSLRDGVGGDLVRVTDPV